MPFSWKTPGKKQLYHSSYTLSIYTDRSIYDIWGALIYYISKEESNRFPSLITNQFYYNSTKPPTVKASCKTRPLNHIWIIFHEIEIIHTQSQQSQRDFWFCGTHDSNLEFL